MRGPYTTVSMGQYGSLVGRNRGVCMGAVTPLLVGGRGHDALAGSPVEPRARIIFDAGSICVRVGEDSKADSTYFFQPRRWASSDAVALRLPLRQ